MKKITLLFILLTVSVGYSQTFPLDFSNSADAFTYDTAGGTGGDAIINTTSEKLEIFGNGADWDNAFIAFAGGDVVDLSNNAANTITFTMQSTTAPVGEVHTHRIKLTGTGGIFEADWTTTGLEVKTVFIDPPALGNLTELRIFVDRQSSAGGTYLIDDISVFVDAEAPSGFTASVGTIGAFGVELLLNATDNSGTVKYDISYNGGANTVTTNKASGAASFIVSGLTPNTAYSFEVSASDVTGNIAANNPQTVVATTIVDGSTPCEGQSAEGATGPGAPGGTFSVGYTYKFETLPNGTSVKINFTLLDTDKTGVSNVELFQDPGTFSAMTLVSGQEYTITLVGQTPGANLSLAAKFPYAGNAVQTKNFIYAVGNSCALGTKDFEIAGLKLYPNPTNDSWTISTQNIKMSTIQVYDILGKNVLTVSPNATEAKINASSLKAGLYFAKINTANGSFSIKLVKE